MPARGPPTAILLAIMRKSIGSCSNFELAYSIGDGLQPTFSEPQFLEIYGSSFVSPGVSNSSTL